MDLEFTISAREAGSALQVEILENRATVTGLASGRKIVFEGFFGDVRVKLLPAEEMDQAFPTVLAEATAEQPNIKHPVTGESVAPLEAKDEATAEQPDPQLLGRLVALRKQISTEVKLPPFIIFHDSTLKAMCRRLPANLAALGTISGVGEAKLKNYGARFLEVIREYLKIPVKEG
jgi:ATP-dependent DNA helicase RecQ